MSATSLELALHSGSPGGLQSDAKWEDDIEADDETEKQILHRQILEQIRSEINDNTWEAFWLTTVSGENATAVAAKLGMTPANVRQAKRNVKQRIINEFGDLIQ